MYDIINKYGLHRKDVSCPSCGRLYGHHKTKVDKISQECSTCAIKMGYEKVEFVDADEYINTEILNATL